MATTSSSNKHRCLHHPHEDNLPLGSGNPWDNLPIELLDYLLSGLSVKVLMQCRIVCKVWLRKTDGLYPWVKDLNPGKTSIFGCSARDEMMGPKIYGMIRKGDEMIPEQIVVFPELRGFRQGFPGMVSTCNGLILLERQDKSRILESAVINPLTKEMVTVPGSPYLPVAFDNLSLGYDPFSGSHKLVQLLVRDENNNLGAAIYNLRGRIWRFRPIPAQLLASSYGAFENQDQERRGGVCTSGTLHWTLHGPRQKIMVSFDLRREEFELLSTPHGFSKRRHFERYELANVGGCLAVWNLSFGHHIDMWKLTKGFDKKKQRWSWSLVMFLDGPLHTTDNVTGVYDYDKDRLLVQGRCPSTGESLFVMRDVEDRLFKCTLKDRSARVCGGLDVYSPSWDFKSIL